MAKRPTALKYTSIYEQLTDEWQTYFNSCTTYEKSDAMKLRSTVFKDYDFNRITEALNIASKHGHPSVQSINQVFFQLINGQGDCPDMHPTQSLPSLPEATRGLQHYNQLLKGVEIN